MNLKLPNSLCEKYFSGMESAEMASIVEQSLDRSYFSVIVADEFDLTIMSRNTGHFWYLYNPEYPEKGTIILFHKHKAGDKYHLYDRGKAWGR